MPHDSMIGRAPGAYTRPPFAPTNPANPSNPTRPAPQRPDPCADDRVGCPACGGLQCLCRPRFFPGQLLTDEDLNRLQNYVIDKNRLHNRYLHGWGVACGLEVVCDPCTPGGVIVRTGYALSPCGDDIVVCADTTVDLCRLIQDCRPQREPVCDAPYQQDPRECRGGAEEWVLAICYDERPTRGITALTGAGDTRCSCGGSSSGRCSCAGGGGNAMRSTCGCGAGGSSGCTCSGGASTGRRKAKTSPQCEPTQICEGYRFTAWKLPPAARGFARLKDGAGDLQVNDAKYGARQDLMFAWMYANRARLGPMLERLMCCVLRALELRATWREGRKYDGADATQAYLDYAEALREFAADFAIHRCKALAEINRLVDDARTVVRPQWDPTRGPTAMQPVNRMRAVLDQQAVGQRMVALDKAWLNLVLECVCSALLPACPEPAPANCVPLAVLTVDAGDCRVNEICNWRERKLLITWRTVGYWLSWLPWGNLQRWIARLCCGDARGGTALLPLVLAIGTSLGRLRDAPAGTNVKDWPQADVAGREPYRVPQGAEGFGTPFASTASGAALDKDQDPLAQALASDNLLADLAGAFDALRGGASGAPGWATLAAAATGGDGLLDLLGGLVTGRAGGAPSEEIDALKRQLQAQQQQIDELRANR